MKLFQFLEIHILQQLFFLLLCSQSVQASGIFELFLSQTMRVGHDIIFVLENPKANKLPDSKNWPTTQISVVVEDETNSIMTKLITDLSFTTQTFIIIQPSNVTSFLVQLKIIRKFYSDSVAASRIWKPTFFLTVPSFPKTSQKSNESTLSILLQNQSISQNFPVDSDVYLINNFGNQTETYFSELYNLNGITHLRKLNERNNGREFTFLLPKATRRGNFNQTTIKAVAMVDPNYYYQCQVQYVDGRPSRFLERCGNNILNLKKALNFTYEAIVATSWTNILPNGSLTGIGRQVQDGEADIAVTSSINLAYKSQKLLFLHPNEKTVTRVYFVQPKSGTLRDIYMYPFGRDTWLYIFLIWVCIIGTLKLMMKMGHALDDRHGAESERDSGAIIFSIGAMSQQGWHASPSSTPVRIAVLTSLVFGLLIYVAFSASLVSHLSNENVPIKSLNDLLSSGFQFLKDVNLYSANVSAGVIPNPNSTPHDTNQNQPNKVLWVDLENGVKNILHEHSPSSALTCFPDPFRGVLTRLNYTERFFCEKIYSFQPSRAIYFIGMFIRKGSPYKELFNHRIALMKEVGVNNRVNRQYRAQAMVTCISNIGLTQDILGIMDLFSAYIILLSGYASCFIVFLFEKIWARSMGRYIL